MLDSQLYTRAVAYIFEEVEKGGGSDSENVGLSDEDEIEEDTDDGDDSESRTCKSRKEFCRQVEAELEELADACPEIQLLMPEEAKIGHNAMKKIIRISQRVFNKDSLQRKLKKMYQLQGIPPRKLIKHAATCWNTMIHVIDCALYLRRTINSLVLLPEVNKGKPSSHLRHLKLNNNEWNVLGELKRVLMLNNKLEQLVDDNTLLPCVRAGVGQALAVLDKYYSRTDESIMGKSAMTLHPRYKTAWFRDKAWQSSWITTAVDSITDVWNKYYKPKVTVKSNKVIKVDPTDMVDNYGINCSVDTFEAYLSSPQDGDIRDPIYYWTA
ncbi:hypothetical protein V5O48_011618 [Marasmius crinis-equi]|uniref:Transposase n=1 Tax=Marasmius crinis-equi TaxID=585013 RepID=A0ABR3F528_9AGAR